MENTRKNTFKVRVYDEGTLVNLYALFESGLFENMNQLMGKALEIGAESLLVTYGKKRRLTPIEAEEAGTVTAGFLREVRNQIAAIEMTSDDIFVMLNILETLIATVYNLILDSLDKQAIDTDLAKTGFYAELPEFLSSIKSQMIRRMDKAQGRKKEGK